MDSARNAPAEQASASFTERAQTLAREQPAAFAAILQQTYGDKLTPGAAAGLTAQVASGSLPPPTQVRFVDEATLGGALGAYAADGGGTIFLGVR